jgi:hypothetical protein
MKLGKMHKEVAIIQFEVVFSHLPGWIGKTMDS